MKLVGILFVVIIFLIAAERVEASNVARNPSFEGGKLILSQTSTVTITAWLGTASCRVGQVNLAQPEVKLIKSSKNNEEAKNSKPKSDAPKRQPNTIIYNYAVGKPSVEIGPYKAGTELIFEIQTGSFCKSSHLSTEKSYTRLKHNGGNSWTLSYEDWKDMDVDDVYLEITVNPTSGVSGTQAFADEPIYKLSWPNGVHHYITVIPGQEGEHAKLDAYDVDMNQRRGDTVVASEQGTILWIEDSFGSGACPDPKDKATVNYWRSRANVVVVQTETGVNTTYVHLLQGSVTKLNLHIGDHVSQGQTIGQADSSGYACGSHLHFEWQHSCYSVDQAKKRREGKEAVYPIGKPTLMWSCTNFPPDSPYNFTVNGKSLKIKQTPSDQVSDNLGK